MPRPLVIGGVLEHRIARAIRVHLEHRSITQTAASGGHPVERVARQDQASLGICPLDRVAEAFYYSESRPIRLDFENRSITITRTRCSIERAIRSLHQRRLWI